jgi:Dolichyl-phosphate-mannose-protein mannosyltransferase
MRWSWLVLGVLLVGYCSLSGVTPAVDDELYYWCWSKELQWSYYDHPPMTALLIRASTSVFGDTLFAIRLPACLTAVAVLGVLFWLTRPRKILWGAVLSPMFTFGAVLITPDTPLLLYWALYLAWLVKVHQFIQPDFGGAPGRAPWFWWAMGGAILGCGILGKYTAGLAVPAGFLSFCLLGVSAVRRWLPGYLLHLVCAFAASAPILLHNIQHDFGPLLYQFQHATATEGGGWKSLFEFLGVQILLVGTLPVVLLPWVLFTARQFLNEARLRVTLCLYALPMLFFVVKAYRGPVEGNWAMVSYLAFWPLAAKWAETIRTWPLTYRWFWVWATRLSFAIPILGVAAVGAHLVKPLPIWPIKNDRVYGVKDRHELFEKMAADIKTLKPLPVFTDSYQNVALLRFYGIHAEQEAGMSRPSHFTQVPKSIQDQDEVYFFGVEPIENAENIDGVRGTFGEHVRGFGRPVLVREWMQQTRGVDMFPYKLFRYTRVR